MLKIPAFDWPAAPFPSLQYPLSAHVESNRREEDRCLQRVEELLESWHLPIAGCIVEPVQAEGGDNGATPYFFQQLRKITKKHDVALIVDEVQTGQWTSTNGARGPTDVRAADVVCSCLASLRLSQAAARRARSGCTSCGTWRHRPSRSSTAGGAASAVGRTASQMRVHLSSRFRLPLPLALVLLPSIVTFSKKLQAAGFYHNIDMRPNLGYRNFNTYVRERCASCRGRPPSRALPPSPATRV